MSDNNKFARNEELANLEEGKLKKDGTIRSKTLNRKQMNSMRGQEEADTEMLEILEQNRPEFRYQCKNGPRPCVFFSCKYNLYLDINPKSGSIKFNFPNKEVWELEETCALDVAERGGMTLEDLGGLLNLTRERIRQYERNGLTKLRETLGEDFDIFFPDNEF